MQAKSCKLGPTRSVLNCLKCDNDSATSLYYCMVELFGCAKLYYQCIETPDFGDPHSISMVDLGTPTYMNEVPITI